MPVIYNQAARKRIDSVVVWGENRRTDLQRRRKSQLNSYVGYAEAIDDIEHGDSGETKLLTGQWDDFANLAPGLETRLCFNQGRKIWGGSHLWVFLGTLESSGQLHLVSEEAWSASFIRGVADTDILPGETKQISSVVTYDGHYNLTTADVYLPTTQVKIKATAVTWATLRFDEGTGLSIWEATNADCLLDDYINIGDQSGN